MSIKKGITTAVKIAVQNSIPYYLSILDPFLKNNPEWQLIFYSAIGLYGVYMAYNQEEVNEIVDFINEHPDEFRKEIVESDEFRKGFLIFTEQYLKQRVENKKKILRKIILGYSISSEKSKYELERLNGVLVRISIESLEFLNFFKLTIFPAINKQIEGELKQDSYQKSDRSLEWWYDSMIKTKPIWEPIDKWIHENFNQNSHKVKKQYNMLHSGYPSDLLHRINNLERSKRDEIMESITEIVSLGILRLRVTGGSIGSGSGSEYNFTAFGRRFLTLLD